MESKKDIKVYEQIKERNKETKEIEPQSHKKKRYFSKLRTAIKKKRKGKDAGN